MREEDGDIRPRKVRSEQLGSVGQEEDEVIEEGVQETLEGEEVQHGERKTAKLNDPKEPSSEERKTHEMTHLPFRRWCRHCIRGRGKEAAHYKRKGEDGELHELHFDYAFMGEEDEPGKTVTLLVVREKKSRMTLSTAVPTKSTGKFVIDRVIAFMKELGIENLDIIAKSDQNPPASI
jgi:hypothetical protein